MLLSEIVSPRLVETTDQAMSTVRSILKSNFKRRGLGIIVSGHSRGQAVTGKRGTYVEEHRLLEAFSKILRLYENNDDRLMGVLDVARRLDQGVQVVFKYPHDNTFTNIPCVIQPDKSQRAGFTFVVKTIMTKPDFKPHSTHDVVIILPEM